MNLQKYIRDIPDFPKKGIVFKDITPLLMNKDAFKYLINSLFNRYLKLNINKIIAVEARGFIIGAGLAAKLGCGFVPIRKEKKLPFDVYKKSYSLEYGVDTIEIHKDSIKQTDNIVILDDVLATGGTVKAAISLVKNFNCNIIECCFLLELLFLGGAKNIRNENIKHFSLISI